MTATGLALLLILITGGAIYTYIHPVLLPDYYVTIVQDNLSLLWGLDGILPIEAIMNCIRIDVFILCMFLIFKLIMLLTAGSGDID